MVACRAYRQNDRDVWLAMRRELWPDAEDADAMAWLQRTDAITVLAFDAAGTPAGFVEAGERAYADGCDTSPVAYLEGWYVVAEFRRAGVGSLLLNAVEEWAIRQGYSELASDTLLDNPESQAAHLAIGFQEVERAVRYRKSLAD